MCPADRPLQKGKSWLLLYDAGLAIQLVPGQLLLFPSALFLHSNVDVDQSFSHVHAPFNIVWTEEGEPNPTLAAEWNEGRVELQGQRSVALY